MSRRAQGSVGFEGTAASPPNVQAPDATTTKNRRYAQVHNARVPVHPTVVVIAAVPLKVKVGVLALHGVRHVAEADLVVHNVQVLANLPHQFLGLATLEALDRRPNDIAEG